MLKFLLGLAVFFAIIIGFGPSRDNDPLPPPLTPEERAARDRTIAEKAQRDRRIGQIAVAVRSLREAMHDPGSFKLTKALVMEGATGCFEYRAKNGFGGVRQGQAVYHEGTLATSDDRSGRFRSTWKRYCQGKIGQDITAAVEMLVL
jgi:hypothetical protein